MKQTSTIEVSTRGDKNEMKSFKTVVVCAWTSIVPCASGSLSSSEERAVRLASATASFCCDKVGDDAAVVAVVAAVAAVAVAIVVVVVAAAVAVAVVGLPAARDDNDDNDDNEEEEEQEEEQDEEEKEEQEERALRPSAVIEMLKKEKQTDAVLCRARLNWRCQRQNEPISCIMRWETELYARTRWSVRHGDTTNKMIKLRCDEMRWMR